MDVDAIPADDLVAADVVEGIGSGGGRQLEAAVEETMIDIGETSVLA